MSYAYTPAPARPGLISRTLNWMDERGPLSWIVVMVGSFIFGGPLGLLVLGFILITGRFRSRARREGIVACGPRLHFHASRPTGNRAFDAYKADTLARLEREQDEFEAFLIRLREARDKAEFDQYMDERARAAAESAPESAPKKDDAPEA
ncbi:DUF2852 domain-containing protein [Paenirhodobacter sp.]|uniref:DUF2852 domain-containing protein n=1 Tax=Paenirhodobacter sp. TaxID=1965326 RepID=UPI003B408F73